MSATQSKEQRATDAVRRAIRELEGASTECDSAAYALRELGGTLTLAEKIDDDGRIETLISILRACQTLAVDDRFLAADIADGIRILEAANS